MDDQLEDPKGAAGTGWLSFHFYYHESLDRLVAGLLCPLVGELLRTQWIGSFFFIRYGVGGPHVRLRLLPAPDRRDDVVSAIERASREYFLRSPSRHSFRDEQIEAARAARPEERLLPDEPSLPEDNSLHAVGWVAEVDRYGGPVHFAHSLDFFAVSSAVALAFGKTSLETERSTRLARAFAGLATQGLGFARDPSDLGRLLSYAVDDSGAAMPTILDKADWVAKQQCESQRRLLAEALAAAESRDGLWSLLARGARVLAARIDDLPEPARLVVGRSQLHMTACRLGLSNVEEVYVGRLLALAVASLGERIGQYFAGRDTKAAVEEVESLRLAAFRHLIPTDR